MLVLGIEGRQDPIDYAVDVHALLTLDIEDCMSELVPIINFY